MRIAMINKGPLILLSGIACANVHAVSASSDFSEYPCDIFTSAMCFRIPNGAIVNISSPADYYLYEVKMGNLNLVTVYKGRAPESRPEKATIVDSYNSDYGKVTIYATKAMDDKCPNKCLDVYIDSPKVGDSTIHLHSVLDAKSRGSLVEFISSFRLCQPLDDGGQRCKRNDVWSRNLLDVLHKIMEDQGGAAAGPQQ